MNTIKLNVTRDSQNYTIEMPEEYNTSAAITVDGLPVPSGNLYNMLIEGVDYESDRFVDAVLDAATYRVGGSSYFAVVHVDGLVPGEETEAQFGDYYIAKRYEENERRRIWAPGTPVKFLVQVTPEIYALFVQWLEAQGWVATSVKENTVFVNTPEQHDKIVSKLDIEERIKDDRHTLTRLAIMMNRPGGYMQRVDLEECNWVDSGTMDGTVAITDKVDAPRQITGAVMQDGNLAGLTKGIIRPPITVERKNECGGTYRIDEARTVAADLQFGKALNLDGSEPSIMFSQVRTLTKERASLNLQAIMFGAQAQDEVISQDTEVNYRSLDVHDLLTDEESAKVHAGLPAALFLRKQAPWDWFTKFSVKGCRGLVICSNLIDLGSMELNHAAINEMKRNGGTPEVGAILTMHRDPAVSDASSMHNYCYSGEFTLDLDVPYPVIAINPNDEAWKAAGGDFDGDMGVVFNRAFALKPRIPVEEKLRTFEKEPSLQYKGQASNVATIGDMMFNFTGYLGPSVVNCMRLAETGWLTDDMAALGAVCTQGAVDAKKHAVDTRRGIDLYEQLANEAFMRKPAEGYFIDALLALRRTKGEDAKVKAWNKLGGFLKSVSHDSTLYLALYERFEAINNVFQATQVNRGSRLGIPSSIRNTARMLCIAEGAGPQVIENVRRISATYRDAVRNKAVSDGEDRFLHQDAVALARASVRLALANGEITEMSLLAYGPHRLAAEMCGAEAVKACADSAARHKVLLIGDNWSNDLYEAKYVFLAPSCDDNVVEKLNNAKSVRIEVLRVNKGGRSTTAYITF